VNAWRNTLSRSFQHRRLWSNDPDCLMLRNEATDLDEQQMRTWARAVAASGGLALVSDDLALLDDGARRLLDEVVEVGRAVDAAACSGLTPLCPDLLSHALPTTLTAPSVELVADPEHGVTRAWTAPGSRGPA
jgi:alpha-galactosidase